MKQIDFLPSRYREQQTVRKSRIWRCAVSALFAVVIGAVCSGQYAIYRSVKADLSTIQQQHTEASTKIAQLQRLQGDLAAAQHDASLYTYLQHPWPVTQVLSELTRRLPAAIQLNELSIAKQAQSGGQSNGVIRLDSSGDPATDAPPAAQDLQALRGRHDTLQTIVQVSGQTDDPAALHGFVAALGESSLLDDVKLDSLEAVRSASSKASSKFLIQLHLRPGYGQAGGPTSPPANLVVAAVITGGDNHE